MASISPACVNGHGRGYTISAGLIRSELLDDEFDNVRAACERALLFQDVDQRRSDHWRRVHVQPHSAPAGNLPVAGGGPGSPRRLPTSARTPRSPAPGRCHRYRR